MPASATGFWSDWGAPASVDWCEPNYLVSPYVAEWWNTLSSFAIVALGLAGVLMVARAAHKWELRFSFGFLAILIIGIGSVAFHGTLLKLSQASDELPMIFGSLVYFYTLRWRAAEAPPNAATLASAKRTRRLLIIYAVAFACTYNAWPQIYPIFILTYVAMVAWIVMRSAVIAFGRQGSPLLRRLVLWSAGSYLGGVGLLWIPEHLLLGCDHPLQALQLHALFHFTSALGTYAWILFAMVDRARCLGGDGRIVGTVSFVEFVPGSGG